MIRGYSGLVISFGLFALAAGTAAAQSEETLTPSQDNTIYEESGDLSNGEGVFLYIGRTGPNAGSSIRRALIAFDVADALPDDAEIESVELVLNQSKSAPGSDEMDVAVHRLTRSWGEGTSDAGNPGGDGADAQTDDATWTHAFFDSETWDSEGGDFDETASATFTAAADGSYTATSDALAADVQTWVDDPDANFGWILIGDETTVMNARQFDSSEHATESRRPQLIIQYSTSTAKEQPDVASSFMLEGNYPNPFSRSTSIRYRLERAQDVSLDVYDVTGRPVKTIDRRVQTPGSHDVELAAGDLASGLYIYCLSTASTRECRTLTVMR